MATEGDAWLAGLDGNDIELRFLPMKSLEANPAELGWSPVKGTVGKEFVEMTSGLKARPSDTFEELREAPKKIQRFFRQADCLYELLDSTLQRLSK